MLRSSKKILRRRNGLLIVGIVMAIASAFRLIENPDNLVPVEVEIRVHAPDDKPLTVDIDIFTKKESTITIFFPEDSAYDIEISREPHLVTSWEPSEGGTRHSVPAIHDKRLNTWKIADGLPDSGEGHAVRIEIADFLVPRQTGHEGLFHLKVTNAGLPHKELSVFPAIRAPYGLSLSTSIPEPIEVSMTGKSVDGKEFVRPEGDRMYYIYGQINGNFLAKWEFYDAQRAGSREWWLVFWSTLLGLGIGFTVEGLFGHRRNGTNSSSGT